MTHYYDMTDTAEHLEGGGEDVHRAVLDTLNWLDKAKVSLATLVDARREKESFCIASEYSFKHADGLCPPPDPGEAKAAESVLSGGTTEKVPARSDEVSNLRKANLRLQDELHCAKNKLVELQLAAPCNEKAGFRGDGHGAVLEQFAHENAALRLENARLREQMDTMAQEHAAFAKYGTQKLQEKAPRAEAHGNMVNQLMSLEEELAQQVRKNSDLVKALELFVCSVQEPLAAIRESCRLVVDCGRSLLGVKAGDLPPCAPDGVEQDMDAKLRGIGEFLASAADIISSSVQMQQMLHWAALCPSL